MSLNSSLFLVSRIKKHKFRKKPSTVPSEHDIHLEYQDYIPLRNMLDFTAGCLGGVAGVVVGHPLDTIKVHLQTQSSKNPIYRGIWHCGKTLLKKDGIRGLYRGITSPMAGVGGVNAIVFGIYGNVQRQFKAEDSIYAHGAAGAIAGLVQSFVCSPVELAKIRLQLQKSEKIQYKSPSECMLHIMRREGLRGFYRGLLCTIVRDVPSISSYFVSYECMMRLFDKPHALHSFVAGGIAGMVSWAVCYPTDVVKSCMQADGMYGTFKYTGVVNCIKKNYANDGVNFFFRGFNSTIVRAFPVNAACFSIVSVFLRLFKGSGIDVTVHTNEPLVEPMVLLCLDRPTDRSFGHVVDHGVYELQRKRALMRRSLRAFDVFNEGIINSDIDDIVNDFYPEYYKYFHQFDEQYEA